MRLRLRRPSFSPRFRRLLLLAALAGLAVNGYAYVYLPFAEGTRALRQEAADLRARVETLRRQVAEADAARRELEAVQAELAALAATFPPGPDEPRLMEFWEQAATAAGLRLGALRWGEGEAAGAFTRRRVELEASGPYAGQVQFALALQGMPWLYRLDAVTMTAAGAGSAGEDGGGPLPGAVKATYRFSLFFDAPPPQPAGGR